MRTWILLSLPSVALALAVGGFQLDAPGPYYDEAIQAGPARDFLDGSAAGIHASDLRTIELAGRPFPWRTAVYMGALKSQLLIPSFALFGPSLEGLRLTTLAWGLIGLALAIRFAQLWLGPGAAALTGLLLALDASFVFVSRHDWGSFAASFALRCAALVLVTVGWRRPRTGLLLLGGLALGLGFYNKVDFATFLIGSGAAALIVGGLPWLRSLATRRRALVSLAIGVGLGALPMATSVLGALRGVAVIKDRSPIAMKRETFATMLDGSYFARLLEAGGRLDHIGAVPGAPASLLPIALALAAAAALGLALSGGPRTERVPSQHAWALPFVWLAGGLTALLVFALPGAGSVHHALNVYPYPHLAIAGTAAALFRRAGGSPRGSWLRGTLAIALALVLASQAHGLWVTHQVIERTGGKGWWSDALVPVVAESAARGDLLVSLDWGFHEQVLFLGGGTPRALEPFWEASRRRAGGEIWHFDGGPNHVYLLHERDFDQFRIGPRLLTALRLLPDDAVRIDRHRDRDGDVAFVTVRILQAHRIRDDGRLRIDLLPDGS